MGKIISPSILSYELCLEESIEKIRKMIDWGIEWIHVDIMRAPFIPNKNTFSEELIFRLYNEFKDEVNFDFHLMISNPDEMINIINEMVDFNKRKNVNITIHREAYRKGLGKYDSKKYDLFEINTTNPSLNKILRDANIRFGDLVYKTLSNLKENGYKTGLALEPNTSLMSISKRMIDVLDLILLMSVSSGAGNQKYRDEVTDKIEEFYKYYNLMIQVDGGMNEETIPKVMDYVDNIVIGSYITKNYNPIVALDNIKNILDKKD